MSIQSELDRLNQPATIDPSLPSCPFCGASPEVEYWHGGGPDKRMISCSSAECDVAPSVTGETLSEARANWSKRIPAGNEVPQNQSEGSNDE